MVLEKINLSHFRNYTDRTFSFSKNLTIVVGANTAGKTTILEAIMLVATGSSFRAEREREMIQTGTEVGRTTILLASNNQPETIETVITNGIVQGVKTPYKKFSVNKIPKRRADIMGSVPAVLFWPEDLYLIIGSPSGRRRYLDTLLSQADRTYYRSLVSYEKALRVRNKLLSLIREGIPVKQDELSFWEKQLIDQGSSIHEKRNAYITRLNAFHMPSSSNITFNAVYDHSVVSRERFNHYHDAERGSGTTLIGPHRDDIIIYKGYAPEEDTNLKKFGSRGEQRLGVLWMKLSELSFLKEALGTAPLLLLDDILSELDTDHQHLVFNLLFNQQTILTTTDSTNIPAEIEEKAEVIRLT